MSTAAILVKRKSASAAAAAECTARILAALVPLSPTRTMRYSGMATAADIRAYGIVGAVLRPSIPACSGCGRRARRKADHGPNCRRATP